MPIGAHECLTLFEEHLTRAEADRRIEALREEIALANSF